MWDVKNLKMKLNLGHFIVWSACFSRESEYSNWALMLWSVGTGKKFHTFSEHSSHARSAMFSVHCFLWH